MDRSICPQFRSNRDIGGTRQETLGAFLPHRGADPLDDGKPAPFCKKNWSLVAQRSGIGLLREHYAHAILIFFASRVEVNHGSVQRQQAGPRRIR